MSSGNNHHKESTTSLVVALVGDSDIARWPQDLLPAKNSGDDDAKNHEHQVSVCVKGENGATLCESLPLVTSILEETQSAESLLMVFCAGENDISQGTRLDETLISFCQLLEKVFPINTESVSPTAKPSTGSNNYKKKHLLILGPKFEPWLEYDPAVRKDYVKMSHAMQRACQKFDIMPSQSQATSNPNDVEKNDYEIVFVDCLTMFCGESGQQPGALLGGRANPEKKFFDYDQLHLSREGYAVWKSLIERHISSHFCEG